MKRARLLMLELYLMILIGMTMIYSASSIWAAYKYNNAFYYWQRQLLFVGIGTVAMWAISRIDISKYRRYASIALLACFLALIVVLIPGIGVMRNGSRSWFGVGSFLIQPAEFFKLALIFYVSDRLAKKKTLRLWKDIVGVLCITFVGFGIILLQPDFGTGLVMVCSILFILFAAAAPLRYFIALAILGVGGLTALILAAPYRLARILSFLDPWSDPLGSGFQIIQSMFAIGPGSLFGLGFQNSIQKHFYLPEPQTDFIFSILCEELGFIGGVLVIVLFGLILYEGMQIALHAKDVFLSYVAIGIIGLFAIQVMINLGVVVGLFPVTGITLPLVSYGGSSLVMMMSSFGIIIGIGKHGTYDVNML